MDERSETVDPLIRRVADTLRTAEALDDRAAARAMAVLRRETQAARWRRSLYLATGMAAALGLITGLRLLSHSDGPRPIRFALAAPGAAHVAVIGDFNDWDPVASPLRAHDGGWTVTLRLPPGRYRYAFVVDGARLEADPATARADDEFGAPTSVVTVPN